MCDGAAIKVTENFLDSTINLTEVMEIPDDGTEREKKLSEWCEMHRNNICPRSAIGDHHVSRKKVIVDPIGLVETFMRKVKKFATWFSYSNRLKQAWDDARKHNIQTAHVQIKEAENGALGIFCNDKNSSICHMY